MGSSEVAAPRHPITYELVEDPNVQRKLFGYATSYCNSPQLQFFIRPEKNQACVVDGSEYQANLITGEDFGCTLHEKLED